MMVIIQGPFVEGQDVEVYSSPGDSEVGGWWRATVKVLNRSVYQTNIKSRNITCLAFSVKINVRGGLFFLFADRSSRLICNSVFIRYEIDRDRRITQSTST